MHSPSDIALDHTGKIAGMAGVSTLERDYLALVRQFARMLHNRSLAEDLVNDAVAESLSKLRAQQVRDPDRLAGFVYGVAINMLRNHRRRFDNRDDLRAAVTLLDDLYTDDDAIERHDRDRLSVRVRAVIEDLPTERDRQIVRRFYLDEEEKATICADLQLSATHFDRVIFRARQRMKALLSQ